MQRIDGPTRAAALPVPAAVGTGGSSPGYFTDGDPANLVPPTTVTPDWANMVQEELVSVVTHAGFTLDKGNHGQLLEALLATFVAQGQASGVVVGATEASIPLPGGFSIKVGTVSGTYSEGPLSHNFDTPFANKCWAVIPIVINSTGSNGRDVWSQRESISAAGFTLFVQWTGAGGTINSIDGVDYIAIGN